MGTDGRFGAGSARDSRINLAPVAQTQETPCWCMKSNIDPEDLVITVFIIIATAYCILTWHHAKYVTYIGSFNTQNSLVR